MKTYSAFYGLLAILSFYSLSSLASDPYPVVDPKDVNIVATGDMPLNKSQDVYAYTFVRLYLPFHDTRLHATQYRHEWKLNMHSVAAVTDDFILSKSAANPDDPNYIKAIEGTQHDLRIQAEIADTIRSVVETAKKREVNIRINVAKLNALSQPFAKTEDKSLDDLKKEIIDSLEFTKDASTE